MADIRLKKITVEPLQAPLVIQQGNINITDTSVSDSKVSGAFISNGGVGINCTHDATSSTSGGSMTVGGGAAVTRNLYVGRDIVADSSMHVLQINGLSKPRLLVDTVANKMFSVAPDGVNTRFEVSDTAVQLKHSATSTSASEGGLIVAGGIAVFCTADSSSASCGGALTIAGGASVARTLCVGQGVNSLFSNTLGNMFTVNTGVGIGTTAPVSSLTITPDLEASKVTFLCSSVGNHYGIGVSSYQQNYHVADSSGNHVFYQGGMNGDGTLLMWIGGNGLVGVGTSAPQHSVDVVGEMRISESSLLLGNSNTIGNMFTTGGNVGIGSTVPATALHVEGDGTFHGETTAGTVFLSLSNGEGREFGLEVYQDDGLHVGLITNNSNHTSSAIFITSDGAVGVHNTSPTYGLDISGSVRITAGSLLCTYDSNTVGTIFTTGGSVGVGTPSPSHTLDVLGNIRSVGELIVESAEADTQVNVDAGNNGQYASIQALNSAGTIERDLCINPDGGAVAIGTTNPIATLDVSGTCRISQGATTTSLVITGGSLKALFNANTVGSIFTTGGNVGINQTNPSAALDVTGGIRASSNVVFSNTQSSTCSSIGSLVLQQGGLGIDCTVDATSLTRGGGITISGGVSIAKKLFVGGVTKFTDTTPSTSYSIASVLVQGGVSIQESQNAANIGNGGALTVQGGASIGGDLWVGGEINGSGSSSSTFAYLTLTSTEEAVNLTSGALVTFGGITVQCTTNSSSVTNGGSLLVDGGASFRSDMYVGGQTFLYNSCNFQSEQENVINLSDSYGVRRFSINLDAYNNDWSLCRYDENGDFAEASILVSHETGMTTVQNTRPSESPTAAAFVVVGGVSVSCSVDSTSLTDGGAMTVAGGQSVSKQLLVGGDVTIFSSTASNNVSSGALLVHGGVGITGNMNLLGNAVINGNLTVSGSTTSVESVNTNIGDNLIVLNSGPVGSKDSGIIVERFQQDNNNGEGDVVNDEIYIADSLPNQSGMTGVELKLSSQASAANSYYDGWWVKVSSGFSNGQVRKVTAYDGNTKIATLSSAWVGQNPAIGDVVHLYNRPYVGLVYNEINDRFEFGATAQDPGQTNVSLTSHIPIVFESGSVVSTLPSSNATSGALLLAGGLSISNTTNAGGVTAGGSLTTLGGASFAKHVYVGDGLTVNGVDMTPNPNDVWASRTFQAENNMVSFQNVDGLVFPSDAWGFDVYLAARLTSSGGNLSCNFHIRGVNKQGAWEVAKSYVGDDMAINFGITNLGQVQYTSPNYTGFEDLTFKWRALCN